ncbi:MAG: NAD(P)/FAD-dependent oxidoreductase [Woeseia sp.]
MTDRTVAIVIGAGHNGLVCATSLARAGMQVLCVEAGDVAGGMAAQHELAGGYRVPALAHVAYPVSAALRRELGLDKYGYAPGPSADTIMLDEQGRHLVLGSSGVSGPGLAASDETAYPAFRQQYLRYARILGKLFDNKPPALRSMPFTEKAALAGLGLKLRFGLGRTAMYEFLRVAGMNIFDVLNDVFTDDRLKAGIALDAVMGSAMGPRTPGTVLTWLQRLNGALNGPLSVQSGTQETLLPALVQAAEGAGVELRLNARVERILIENGCAAGVVLQDGQTIAAGLVVSGVDPRETFSRLVGARHLDAMFAHRVTQIRGKGVVAKLHLALSGQPGFSGLSDSQLGNRLVVAPSMRYMERAFNSSKYGECPEQPVLEITVPSWHNPSLAPANHHVMSVNVACIPCDLEGGWAGQREALARRVISLLGRYAPNLESLIVDHELLTPQDIEQRYGAVHGHWHHGELSMHQSFMLRPLHGASRYDTPVAGLFLCSAGCHPGGGLTGLPGRNAARRIIERRTAP